MSAATISQMPRKTRYYRFAVKDDKIQDFLGILDNGECALVTYRASHDDYLVELSNPIADPDILHSEGVTPLQEITL